MRISNFTRLALLGIAAAMPMIGGCVLGNRPAYTGAASHASQAVLQPTSSDRAPHERPQDAGGPGSAERVAERQHSQVQTTDQRDSVARNLQIERERGYRRITFEDFKLDGYDLATNGDKIAMTGLYLKRGEAEYLLPSVLAIAMMRERLGAEVGIGLLTEAADRGMRKYLLGCQNNPAALQIGCKVNLLGRATTCRRVTLGGSSNVPCLLVDDGWVVQ